MKIDGFDQATTVEMAATLPDWFDQYNTALAVVARPALGVVQGDVAVSAVSPHAMTLSAGDRTVTVGFERPVRGFEELVDAVVALAEAARRETSDRSPTDLEQVMSSVRTQQLHHGAVIECARLSASVGSVRIGPFPSFRSLGWDQAVSLFTGADGRPVPADMTFEQVAGHADRAPGSDLHDPRDRYRRCCRGVGRAAWRRSVEHVDLGAAVHAG